MKRFRKPLKYIKCKKKIIDVNGSKLYDFFYTQYDGPNIIITT